DGIELEMGRILASREATIFKVVALYHKAINGQKIDLELVKKTIKESPTDVERSMYSFFLVHAFEGARKATIGDCVEKALNAPSQEVNLIGCFLYRSTEKIF